MYRLLLLFISLLYTACLNAQSSYQIDVIFFSHPKEISKASDSEYYTPLLSVTKQAISLSSGTSKGYYQLLKPSLSNLRNEYYLLSRKSKYKVLAQYSWTQPANNQSAVALPDMDSKEWNIHGTMLIKQSNYYLLTTDLQLISSSQSQASFTLKHKQRLKGSTVYYLDHAQVGMLIKIHTV